MKNYYIYNLNYKEGKKQVSVTLIFCPGFSVDISQLQQELKNYYVNHFQTDKTIIIGGQYIDSFAETIVDNKDVIFKFVPRIEGKTFFENLHVLSFNINGELVEEKHEELNELKHIDLFRKEYLNQGLSKIFVERGGLVESTGSHHHYTFPSGRKHSDKFLRVANVLLYSSEIYFIAFSLSKYFTRERFKEIYCDTSSINSVAIALIDLTNRFCRDEPKTFPINSFESYEGLYSGKVNLKNSSFVLISASTSGNIIEYILNKHQELKKNNIVVIFYLDNTKSSKVALEQVSCNLTKDEKNP